MMGLSLFLGCVIPNRYPGIEIASKLCLAMLGVDCVELEGASCCPAPGVFRSIDKATWLALSARNIALSEAMDRDILTVCNGCFATLADANETMKKDAELREETNTHLAKIGRTCKGDIDIRHILEYLYKDIGTDALRNHVVMPLDLRVAVHYGCHLLRPSEDRKLGSVERPVFFDELVECLGATSVDYPDKNDCCGAGGGVRSAMKKGSLGLTQHKLSMIAGVGVDCIVNACPFCHMQLDSGQDEIKQLTGMDYNIPVLHYTQLLGLALGLTPQMLGLHLNITQNKGFIEKLEKGHGR